MWSLLVEGFESAWLPCSLILLVPGAASLLAARFELVPALTGFASSALFLSWIRFSDRGADWPVALAALALIVATVLFVIPPIQSEDVVAAFAGVLAGGASAELWEPCVGAHFGQLLNELPDRGASGFVLLLAYVVGVLSPLAAFAALIALFPQWILDPLRGALSIVGATVLAVMAVATAVGLHDDVVGQLIQWSL